MNPIEAEQFRYSAKFRIISLAEARRFMRLARTKDSTLRRVLFQVVLKASFIGRGECEQKKNFLKGAAMLPLDTTPVCNRDMYSQNNLSNRAALSYSFAADSRQNSSSSFSI